MWLVLTQAFYQNVAWLTSKEGRKTSGNTMSWIQLLEGTFQMAGRHEKATPSLCSYSRVIHKSKGSRYTGQESHFLWLCGQSPSHQSMAWVPVALWAHLIHRWVEGEELGVPVGSSGFLILPLKLLRADMPQQVFQAGIRLQAAQVKVRGSWGTLGGLLSEHVHGPGPCLSENEGTAKLLTACCTLGVTRFLLPVFQAFLP